MWRRFLRDPVAVGAAVIILAIILVAIFAPYIAPQDPYKGMTLRRLRPPGTAGFPLGTDELGRDMLSRLIFGARLSLFMGVTPVLFALFLGSAIGIAAGYAGGWLNTILMRTIDVLFAFPSVLLAIALSGALGAGILNGLISLTVVFIPPIARVAESVTTSVRSRDYVEAAQGQRRRTLHHHPRAGAGQRHGADLRLRHEPRRRIDDPGLGPVVPGARRQAAGARVGPDAQHAAHRHLHAAALVRAARA